MKFLLFFLLLIPFGLSLNAQISPKGVPISFNGNGWKLIGDNYGMSILGHDTVAGAIVLIEHGYTDMQSLRNQLESGYQEEGFNLYPNGAVQSTGNNMLSISMNGYADGNAIKSEAIGMFTNSPTCKGFILLSITDEYSDNSTHKSHMIDIAKSIKTKSLVKDPVWSQKLNGHELVYRDSYSTNSSSGDGSFYVGANSNSTEKYMFCSNGIFYYSSSSSVSTSGSGLDGNSSNSNDSDGGTWSVHTMEGASVIKLIFNDGTVLYQQISGENGYYYMGEQKYTRGPTSNCN